MDEFVIFEKDNGQEEWCRHCDTFFVPFINSCKCHKEALRSMRRGESPSKSWGQFDFGRCSVCCKIRPVGVTCDVKNKSAQGVIVCSDCFERMP